MRFWIMLAFCLLSFCLATEAQAQCRGGSCGVRSLAKAATAPVRALRERKPVRNFFGRVLGR